jgi:polysaccharide export outer membrane protein
LVDFSAAGGFMFRSSFAFVIAFLCLSVGVLPQAAEQAITPAESVTVPPGQQRASTITTDSAETSGTTKVHQDRAIRIGVGDLLHITVYGAPDLTTEDRVNGAGTITMPLIGTVHVAGLNTEQAEQLIATRFRDGELVRDPQVFVFQKEFAAGGIAVMGEVQKPGVYTLIGDRRLLDAISVAGGLTPRAGQAVTITHSSEPDKPTIVDLNYFDPSQSPAANVEVFPGDTVVVSRAGVVYVVGAVAKPAGFVMENNQKLTVLQVVALAGGTLRTSSLKGTKILRGTPDGMQEIPIPLNKILQAKALDPYLEAQDILFIPNSPGKQAAITAGQAAVAVATGLAIYRP